MRLGKVSEEQKIETVLFAGSEKFFGIGEVVDNRSLQKLLPVTSYVRRFVENLKVNLGKDRKVPVEKYWQRKWAVVLNFGLNMNNYFYKEELILEK